MVKEVVSYDEFFGLNRTSLSYDEWYDDSEDDDIMLIINALLVILQEFYIEHQYDLEKEWLKDSVQREFNQLNKELYDTAMELLDDLVKTTEDKFNADYNIPTGYMETDVYFDDVINSGIDSVVNQLQDEIRNKADFYNSMILTTGVFSIDANFRRAIKRLKGVISNNAHHGKKVIERQYMEFVYGSEALFDWIPSGINTCPWCYEIADMSPLPLSSLPVDHINGRCSIVPHDPTSYSSEYMTIQGWR